MMLWAGVMVAMAAGCDASGSGNGPDRSTAGTDSTTTGDSSVRDRPGAVADRGGTDTTAPSCGDVESFVPAWAKNATPSKEIFVSPTGSDGNDGSKDHPYKTTAKAWAARAAGVRINFATGTFQCPPFTSDLIASTASPFIVRAVDGPRTAKFDCGGTGSFFLSHVKGVVLDGLEISNTGGHGVQVDSGSGLASHDLSADLVLMHSHVHHTKLAGIKVAQSQRVHVIGNEFDHIGPGRQDVEFVASDMPVIVGNDAHDSDAFDEVKGGAHGGIIALNRIHDMNPGAMGILVGGDCTGYQYLVDSSVDFEAKDLYVWGNVITGTDGGAFRVVACHDCIVANNTYWAPAPKAILRVIHDGFDKGSGTCADVVLHNANVRVVNNLFAWQKSAIDVIPSNDDPKNILMDHNLWFAAGDDVTKLYSDIPFVGEAASLYNQDPKLVAPPADVSLGAGSPAKGKGVAVSVVGGTYDHECPPTPPNIGAY